MNRIKIAIVPTLESIAETGHFTVNTGFLGDLARFHKLRCVILGAFTVLVKHQPKSEFHIRSQGHVTGKYHIRVLRNRGRQCAGNGSNMAFVPRVHIPAFQIVVCFRRIILVNSIWNRMHIPHGEKILGTQTYAGVVQIGNHVGVVDHGIVVHHGSIGEIGSQMAFQVAADAGNGHRVTRIIHCIAALVMPAEEILSFGKICADTRVIHDLLVLGSGQCVIRLHVVRSDKVGPVEEVHL